MIERCGVSESYVHGYHGRENGPSRNAGRPAALRYRIPWGYARDMVARSS